MNRLAHIALVSLLVLTGSWAQGQDGTVIDSKQPRKINPAYKISSTPKLVDTIANIPTKEYPLVNHQYGIGVNLNEIQPARLKIVEPLTKLYRGYVKAGLGMYTSPLLDIHFMEKRSRIGAWGVNFRHFSSRDAHKDYHFSGFSDNHLKLYGKRFLTSHTLSGNMVFDYNSVHHYGTMNDTTISREKIRQRFTNFELNGRLKSYFMDSVHINHDIKAGYYYFRDFEDNKDSAKFDNGDEHHFEVSANLNRYLNDLLVQGGIEIAYNNFAYQTVNACTVCDEPFFVPNNQSGNAVVRMKFGIDKRTDKFQAKAGLKMNADLPDQVTTNAQFYVYPDIELSANLFDNIFKPYVGVTGGLEQNTFRSLARENPFLLSGARLRNTNNSIKFYGGFRGALSSKTSFNLGISHGNYDAIPLFFQDTTYSFDNRFEVVYDTFSVTNLYGQLSFHNGEKLKIYGKGEYFLYGDGREQEAWYKPDYKFSVEAVYDMADKIIARANVYVLGGRKGASLKPIEGVTPVSGVYSQDLGTFVDINLGAEYRATKRLSAFIDFNNILANKYRMWYDYPLQGINILGGFTYSF